VIGFKKIDSKFEPEKIFPFEQKLSEGINASDFSLSHLIQPDLFIRVRPGHQKPVEELLKKAGINFRACSADCIALPNGSAIERVLQLNKQAVVQDKSSQRIGAVVRNLNAPQPGRFRTVWDACAAS